MSTGRRFHPGWVMVATGMLCVLAALGFGRFALGMLLPSMAATLPLSYAQSGYVSTGNFVGYLAAVLACGPATGRLGARRVVIGALAAMAGSMLLISRAHGFAAVLALYAVTGVASGAVNVVVMALVARWFASEMRGRAAGFVVIGSGFAIILSGWLIPFVNRARGAEGWRTSWTVLALAILGIAAIAALLLRERPPGSEPSARAGARRPRPAPVRLPGAGRAVGLLGAIYFLFGYTYVIYATFIVTALVRERGFSESTAGSFWSAVGALSLLSGPVFGTLSDRVGRRAGLIVVFAIQMVAYALVAVPLPPIALYASIGCFGLVAWSIPSIMLAAVSEHVGPERALSAFGLITFVFGIGQIAGPSVAGVLAERTGSFSSSFAMAAVMAGAAILLAARLGPAVPEAAAEGPRDEGATLAGSA